jgi:hypothetical protein
MNPAIVTGMHRSGTSAVARLVQELGADVGSNLLPATEGNVFGHFEEAAFIRFHDQLIERLFPKRAPFCEWLPLSNAEVIYTEADRAEARSIWQAHQAAGGNAWKDPRTSLFLDLWTGTLPDAKVIICLRHPYQVHRSLLRRGEPFLHVDYSAAILGWTVYNQRILQAVSALPEGSFIVVDVESAFREPRPLAEGLARFLGRPFTDKALEAIAPGAFHFEDDCRDALEDFEAYFPEAGAAYRRLKQFDFLHPVAFASAAIENASTLRSEEARLIEFEERHGLRSKAKKMLIRSIAVDRQRITDLYKQAVKVDAEKDRLIEDLSRLTENLKQRVVELQGRQQQP